MRKYAVVFFIIVLLCGCTKNAETSIEIPQEDKPEVKSVIHTEINVDSASGEKKCWGYRPVKGMRPEFSKEQINDMEKYNCIYIGDENEKVMYLTFDEGYENGYTEPILQTLKKTGVKAAFFITGSYFDKNEEIIDTMVRDGHIVGNHTENHPSLPEKTDEEVKRETEQLNEKF